MTRRRARAGALLAAALLAATGCTSVGSTNSNGFIEGDGNVVQFGVDERSEAVELTARDREICAAIGPELKRRGLLFVGIDVIGGTWLTEINVTSPTGIVAIEQFDGTDVAGMIWDAIERKVTK